MTDSTAVFYGLAGAASSLIFSVAGSAYGTARTCRGIAKVAQLSESCSDGSIATLKDVTANGEYQPLSFQKIQPVNGKVFIPIIIAGVLAIYGLIFSVIVLQNGE
jgi:hypothetical protein